MRNLVVTEFMSLDGVIENPHWSLPYWNDEIAQFKAAELNGSDDLLLGRVTYEGFAAAWPGREDGERINSMPKHVASTTLEKAVWTNSRIIRGDIEEEVCRLKEQPGQDILVYGSADLIHTLREYDLVDRYQLLVYPVVLGKGKRLFLEGISPVELELVDSKVMGSSKSEPSDVPSGEPSGVSTGEPVDEAAKNQQVVLLTYQPHRGE